MFSHWQVLSTEANHPFRRLFRGTTRFLCQNPPFRMRFLGQLGFCAVAPRSTPVSPRPLLGLTCDYSARFMRTLMSMGLAVKGAVVARPSTPVAA